MQPLTSWHSYAMLLDRKGLKDRKIIARGTSPGNAKRKNEV